MEICHNLWVDKMSTQESIDHEVRLRVQEERSQDFKEIFQDIRNTMHHMDNKIDSQFKWTLAILFSLFGTLILSKLFGQ